MPRQRRSRYNPSGNRRWRGGSWTPGFCALLGMALLSLLGPRPAAAAAQLRVPSQTTDPTGPLVAAVALLCWALALWLLLIAALTLGGRLPGFYGMTCTLVLRRVAPAALRRAVALTLGAGIALGTVGAGAAGATGPAAGAPTTIATGAPLDWPGLVPATPGAVPPGVPGAPGAPASPHPAVAASAATPTGPALVVVRSGDTLWGLAAHDLPATPTSAAIAHAWPSWWAANRAVIGDDPDVLVPGQHLVHPAATPPAGVG